MARWKDQNWNLEEGTKCTDGTYNVRHECVHSAILMDIRDELKKLNNLFHCTNFLEIPSLLRSIGINTKKRKRILTKKADAVRKGSGGHNAKRRALGMKA